MSEAARQPYRDEFAIRIKGKPDITDDEDQSKYHFRAGPQSFGDLDGSISFAVYKEPQLYIWEDSTTEQQIMAFYEWLCLSIPEAKEWVEVVRRKTAFWDEVVP
jgi:hypothetical protein